MSYIVSYNFDVKIVRSCIHVLVIIGIGIDTKKWCLWHRSTSTVHISAEKEKALLGAIFINLNHNINIVEFIYVQMYIVYTM